MERKCLAALLSLLTLLATGGPSPAGEPWGEPAPCPPRFYGQADYLLWWFRGVDTPVLATSDDALASTPPGALGGVGTTDLIGGNLTTGEHHGSRFTVGYWLDRDQTWAVEGNYFFILGGTTTLSAFSPGGALGTPTVFRPFFDVGVGAESALFVAGAGVPGGMNVNVLQRLMGTEANIRRSLMNGDRLSLSVLAGFRFLALDENLDTNAISIGTGIVPTLITSESFATRNRFYGGQVGAEAAYRLNNLSVTVRSKIALGTMDQTVNINGAGVSLDSTTGAILAAGPASLLAQTTNIGSHNRNQLSFVPEVGVQVGYQLTRNMSLSVGYTWLYLSDVARPGAAIDRNTTVPVIGLPPAGAPNPAFNWNNSNFWAQGVEVGLGIRF